MNILMLSMDKTLLGEKHSGGDARERHIKYGEFCDELNVIVFSKTHYEKQNLSNNVFVYSTNSLTRFNYFFDAYKIGQQIYKNNPYDLVIGDLMTGLSAWFLKKKFKIKFLMHFHGDFWQNPLGLEKKLSNYFLLLFSKFLVKRADAIRVVSSGIKDKLVNYGISANKIFVIPTPANLEKFISTSVIPAGLAENQAGRAGIPAIAEKNGIPAFAGMTKNILFVGRLEPVKNLSWFLDVFKNVQENYNQVKLIIAGAGSEEQNLKNKVKELNLKNFVEFIGPVSYENLPEIYLQCDLLVLPSKSESFGKVLIEAGASDKPVVASMTTGAKEIVLEGSTGFLTPIGDAVAMETAILELLNNPQLAQTMGQKAKQHILENFDGQKNLQKIKEMWQKIIITDDF